MNNKCNELKTTLSNDTVEKFKEGKIRQRSQNKSLIQEQISKLKKNRIESLQLLVKKQSSTVEDFV